MRRPTRDGSMIIRRASGQLLISSETALSICKMVVADIYGLEMTHSLPPRSASFILTSSSATSPLRAIRESRRSRSRVMSCYPRSPSSYYTPMVRASR